MAITPAQVLAETPTENHHPTGFPAPDTNMDVVASAAEQVQTSLRFIGSGIDVLTQPLDDFFGDSNQEVDPGHTRISLTYGALSHHLTHGISTGLAINVRVSLPKTQQKLDVFAQNVADELNQEQGSHAITGQSDLNQNQTQIGIMGLYDITQYLNLHWKTGMVMGATLFDPFIKLGGKTYYEKINQWQPSLTHDFFWYNSLGLGSDSRFELAVPISTDWHFKYRLGGLYFVDTTHWYWNQSVNWYQVYSEHTQLHYAVVQNLQPRATPVFNSYDLFVHLRHRLYGQWLYGNIKPGLQWSRSHDYKPDPFIYVGIELFSQDEPW